MDVAPSPSPSLPPSVFSADAAGRLEQAIRFMVRSFLDDGLVERTEVVSLLEDIIQMVEQDDKEGSTSTDNIDGR